MIGRIFAGAIVGLSVLICLAPMRVSALEKCQLPLAEGNCTDSIQRWYFNNKTGVCQQFIYKGCNGNANNFNSTDYCYHACNTTPADSTEEPHSYSITDVSKRIKANKATGQQQLAATAGNDTDDETDDRRPSGAVPVPNGRSTSGLAVPATGSGPQSGGSAPGGIVQPTKEPTLIQNRNPPQQQQQPAGSQPGQSSSSSSASKPKQSPTAPAASAAGGASPSGTSSDAVSSGAASPNRSKRSASGKHRSRHHDENDKEEEIDDEETEHEAEEEEDSTKRSSVKQRGKSGTKHKKTDDEHAADEPSKKHKKTKGEDQEKESSVQDLVERMQKTATKLEKLAKKKSSKKSSTDNVEEHEEKEDEHKNGENETKAEKSESEPAKKKSSSGTKRRAHRRKGRPQAKSSAPDRHGKHSEKSGKKKKSSGSVGLKKALAGGRSKLLDITTVGGEISAVGNRAVKNVKQTSTLAALLKIGLEEGQKAATTAAQDQDDDEDDDDDIEIVGERIRTIILDPTYVFSYTNITTEDMVSLQEMAAQSEISTMQLVEKFADEIVNKSVIKPEVAASAGAQTGPPVSGEVKPASPAAPVQEATEPKQHVKESAPKVTNPTAAAAAAVAGGAEADNEAEKTDANHQSEDNNLEQRPLDVEGPTDNASAE